MKLFNKEVSNQEVIIGSIVLIILAGGIFAWQRGWLKDIQRQEVQQENETANWEIYRDLKYGYEIKYPNGWQIENLSTVYDEASSIKNDVRFYPPQVTLYDKSAKDPFIEVEVLDNSEGNSIPVTFRFTWPTSCKDVEVGDLRFCQFNMYAEDPFGDVTVYALSKDNLIYIVAIKCDLPKCRSTEEFKVFEQVLSTFEFIDQNETANWQTYRNEEHGFEIKYPEDTRISETSNYTIPALNTNKDIITAIQSKEPSYPRSLTGLSVYATDDVVSCSVLNNGKKITETKDINGITFLVYGENLPDSAMGGIRSVFDIYRIVYNNVCYSILSSVDWRDVSFMYSAIGIEGPSSQELEEQQNWIQTQQQLNEQILSTFRFIE